MTLPLILRIRPGSAGAATAGCACDPVANRNGMGIRPSQAAVKPPEGVAIQAAIDGPSLRYFHVAKDCPIHGIYTALEAPKVDEIPEAAGEAPAMEEPSDEVRLYSWARRRGEFSRKEAIEALGLSAGRWKTLRDRLIRHRALEMFGERAGATYKAVKGVDVDALEPSIPKPATRAKPDRDPELEDELAPEDDPQAAAQGLEEIYADAAAQVRRAAELAAELQEWAKGRPPFEAIDAIIALGWTFANWEAASSSLIHQGALERISLGEGKEIFEAGSVPEPGTIEGPDPETVERPEAARGVILPGRLVFGDAGGPAEAGASWIHLTISKPIEKALDELVGTGFWGRDICEAADRVFCEAMRRISEGRDLGCN